MNEPDSLSAKTFIPFESIGLCFSGGGYRASAFALGVFSYLNKIHFNAKPLLQNVNALSTVSGGTLTGAAYALSQAKDQTFDEFYTSYYQFLDDDTLLETGIKLLEDENLWKKNHKKRSLINAFALAYEHLYFKGSFDLFLDEDSTSHLKHVCFNATEFSYGLAFRFQNTGLFGNKPLHCAELKNVKPLTKVADAVASSSCFPFGFEPMVFPDDYYENHADEEYQALKNLDRYAKGVGIMDGGIVDNQGIGSIVNIDKSTVHKRKFDLIMVNDVGSYKMDPWTQGDGLSENKHSLKDFINGLLGYLRPRWYFWFMLLAGVSILVINSMGLIGNKTWPALYILGGVLVGMGFVLSVLGVIAGNFRKTGLAWFKSIYLKKVPEVLIDDVASLSNLSLPLVRRMLTERMTTTFKMVSEIFLKQIRRLNYDLLYSTYEYEHRIITSTVYQLNGQPTLYKKSDINPAIQPAPSEVLKSSSLIASETPTTLWWDKTDRHEERLNNLIACGQFTTCYNLMDYILKLKKDGVVKDDLDELYKTLQGDWEIFNGRPLEFVHVGKSPDPSVNLK